MAIDWDPFTGRQGLGWPVRSSSFGVLDSLVRGVGVLVPSTAAETVSAISFHLGGVYGDPMLHLGVYDAEDLGSTSVTTTYFAPNEEGVWPSASEGVPTNTSGNRHTNIDETGDVDWDDYIHTPTTAGPGIVLMRFASSAGVSGQIISVGLEAAMETVGPINYVGGWAWRTGYHGTGGSAKFGGPTGNGLTPWYPDEEGSRSIITVESTSNPVTKAPWTNDEVKALDGPNWFEFTIPQQKSPLGVQVGLRIARLRMLVRHRTSPLLTSALASPDEAGWVTFTLPSSWSKASGKDYLLVLRRQSASGVALVSLLDSGSEAPGGLVSYRPELREYPGIGIISDLGPSETRIPGVVFHVSGAAGADSQPYAKLTRAKVNTDSTVRQEVTTGSSMSARWLSVLAAGERGVPDADLDLSLTDTSDTLLGSGSVSAHLTADDPLTLDRRQVGFTEASLDNNTQYRLVASSDASSDDGWVVAVLDSDSPPVSADTRGYGGTTDEGDVGDGFEDNLDVPFEVGVGVDAVTGFAASTGSGDPHAGTLLSWTATSHGSDFERYELEILWDGAWHTFAHVVDESVTGFTSHLGRPGVQESYRIRVVTTGGISSAPTTAATHTVPAATCSVLASDDGVNVAVRIDRDAEVEYVRNRVETPRMGRRFPQVEQPVLDRGMSGTWTLHLIDDDGLFTLFDTARTLGASQDLILHLDGERYVVSVLLNGGTVHMPGRARGELRVTEVDDRPPLVTVDD